MVIGSELNLYEKEAFHYNQTLYQEREKSNVKAENSLDAGIQDSSTSISIVVKVEKRLLEMVMKVTNIYKHEIVDTRA